MGCEVSIQVHPMPVEKEIPEKQALVNKNKVYPELKRQLSQDSYVTVQLDETNSVQCDESDFSYEANPR